MNKFISKYFFYYPVTLANGEFIAAYRSAYNAFQVASAAEQEKYKQNHLKNIVEFAIHNSAYYREKYSSFTSFNVEEDFAKLPCLTKQMLINNLPSINTSKSKRASVKTTGGSTGEPVRIFKTSQALARERTATWRAYEWAGIGIGDKQARFWGVPHSLKASLKAKLIDKVANRYRISAFNLSEPSLSDYYNKLVSYRPKYLYGYVSAILALTKFCEANNLAPIKSITAVITTSEVLSENARSEIGAFWGVKVFNEYGCGEVGSIAHECEHGRLHIMSDNLHVELLDSNGDPALIGEIVVTDYFNEATPLIRYRLGDFASFDQGSCPCGRTLPILKGVHGRAYDIIRTEAGRSIHPESVIYIFEELQSKYQSFNQFQIIQTAINQLKIYVVKNSKWDPSLESTIDEKVKSSIDQNIQCEFIYCNEIERERSGKMRVVKSLI